MSSRQTLALAAALLLLMNEAHSHHAFAPVYDEKRTITVEGVVIEFRLVNPHATISMDVTDAAGNVVKWSIELAGRLNLTVGGWTEDSIAAGERVTISGNPTHTGSPRIFLRRLVRADGTELLMPGAARRTAIEEDRRQRALRRDQQN